MAFQIFQSIVQRTVFTTKHACIIQDQLCNYSRWTHRKPSKISFPNQSNYLSEEEIVDLDASSMVENDINTSDYNHYEKPKVQKKPRISPDSQKPEKVSSLFNFKEIDKKSKIYLKDDKKIARANFGKIVSNSKEESDSDSDKKETKRHKSIKVENVQEICNVFDENGDYIYKKLGNNDVELGNEIITLKSHNKRGQCGKVLVEGWRIIADGLLAGCELRKLIFSRLEDLNKLKPFMPAKGPQILKIPYKEIQQWSNLDTSPGIMGIFKTPKLLHQVQENVLPINVICDNIREPGNLGSILRAALGVGCQKVILTKGCVDIWDPKVLRSASGAHFRLPIHTEMSWDDISKLLDDSPVYIADNNSDKDHLNKVKLSKKPQPIQEKVSYSFKERKKQVIINDEDELVDPTIEMSSNGDLYAINIPLIPYFDVDFALTDSVTIVIGGETEGISQDCYKFGKTRNAVRLQVPLMPGVDSLNTGMAMAIITFEIKRQYMKAFIHTDHQDVIGDADRIKANL